MAPYFWREFQAPLRPTFWPHSSVSKHPGHLLAEVDPSVGAPDRRLHDVSGLQVLGPPALR